MAEEGIGCSVHFIPLHRQPYWRDTFSLSNEMFPVADKLYLEEVSLPLYTKMTTQDQQRVVDAIVKVLSCG
jgi:dTDP-4-amino-4,6-dideoxygalactose transaminase